MAGSENFARTKGVEGPAETEAANRPVHVAISYAPDGTIRLFRLARKGDVFEPAAVVQVGDRHVEADVDHRGAALELLVPGGERIGDRLAWDLEAEVDQ